MFSGTVQGTDRSARVPLKMLTQEKNPYTLFLFSVGLCKGHIGVPMHVSLKNLTQEKNPYTLLLCSVGVCKGQIQDCPCALKKAYKREKSLHIISMFSGAVH